MTGDAGCWDTSDPEGLYPEGWLDRWLRKLAADSQTPEETH